ncbi:MAG: hypothetical protein ACLRYN_15490 [Clostridium perfringens]|uniref:Uncharacterized protein n=1 Tax=Clostridium perfringens F262 TaxID=883064 RepID=A0AAV3FDU4_CLOPF|nr:hypothetical protein [Clostridium perfringens]EHK2349193.1 hypothetical protein [Clostridium perfringens]EIA17133.1 hypothetical protein HA1_08342 [Clostridium perfringens F262]ELC8458812.1 hypothetical protein [Clostridium perfringens]MBO3366733.1 hypothetical protein [Clostridium perfringens]MDK0638112.1 hypothetical protein [Clostridium perfringens]
MDKDLELTNVISELAKVSDLDDKSLKFYIEKFEQIYSCKYRHEYSEVTKVLFSIKNDEARDFLPSKIKDIGNSIENKDIKKRVLKLWDHINLENIRLQKLKEISEEANSAFTEVNAIKKKYSDLDKQWKEISEQAKLVDEKLQRMDKDIDNSTSKSITILGIFAGIVMAFTGGISFIASSLQNMHQVSVYRIVLVIILLATSMFDIVFMLMYMIGKFTNSYIGGKCNCDSKIQGCKDKKIRCVVVRYPILIWFNMISAVCILTLSIFYCIDRFNIITKLLDKNIYIAILSMTILLIVYIALISFGFIKIAKIDCEYEYVEPMVNTIGKLFSSLGGRYVKKD